MSCPALGYHEGQLTNRPLAEGFGHQGSWGEVRPAQPLVYVMYHLEPFLFRNAGEVWHTYIALVQNVALDDEAPGPTFQRSRLDWFSRLHLVGEVTSDRGPPVLAADHTHLEEPLGGGLRDDLIGSP